VRITLPFPPTTNNLFIQHGRARVLSPAYRKWRGLVEPLIHAQMQTQKALTGPYHMHLTLDRPDKRGRDLSNYIKAAEDSLVSCGVVRDDSDAVTLAVCWSGRKPGKGANVTIELTNAEF
jgi:crossover junction endodeoxyribonuclease RusA